MVSRGEIVGEEIVGGRRDTRSSGGECMARKRTSKEKQDDHLDRVLSIAPIIELGESETFLKVWGQ